MPDLRSTQNQLLLAGRIGPSEALSARIEHDSEHKFAGVLNTVSLEKDLLFFKLSFLRLCATNQR
jgi:hypothetical protein